MNERGILQGQLTGMERLSSLGERSWVSGLDCIAVAVGLCLLKSALVETRMFPTKLVPISCITVALEQHSDPTCPKNLIKVGLAQKPLSLSVEYGTLVVLLYKNYTSIYITVPMTVSGLAWCKEEMSFHPKVRAVQNQAGTKENCATV